MLASIFLMIQLCDLQWSVTEYKDLFYILAGLNLKYVEHVWCKRTGKDGLFNQKEYSTLREKVQLEKWKVRRSQPSRKPYVSIKCKLLSL